MELVAEFESDDEYLAAYDREIAAGGLLVRGAEVPPGTPLADCTLTVRIAGEDAAEVPARLAAATPGQGVIIIFPAPPIALQALAKRLRAPEPKERLTLPEKLQRATTCDREERFQFLRDPNKQLHVMVLRNPRIAIDEVVWAARLNSLNPDALKLIAEHSEWGQNPTVATALVRNPKTPIPIALKLLPRVPVAELRALAKSQGRPPIVNGAKKQLLSR
jgi:hypothetical protein